MRRRNLAVCLAASLGIATAAGVVTALPASAAAGCTVTYQRYSTNIFRRELRHGVFPGSG